MANDDYTAKEMAGLVDVSIRRLHRFAKMGVIPGATKTPAGWRFDRATIDAWIEPDNQDKFGPGGRVISKAPDFLHLNARFPDADDDQRLKLFSKHLLLRLNGAFKLRKQRRKEAKSKH